MKKYKDLTEAFDVFKTNAIEHGQCTESGNYRLGNKCYNRIMDAIKYIAAQNGYDELKIMLNETNPSIRLWTAYALLHVDTKDAVDTLKHIIKHEDGMIAFNAEITLEEFMKGNI